MTQSRWRILLLVVLTGGLTGQACETMAPATWVKKSPPSVEPTPAIEEYAGKGAFKVHGASLYSAGQKIFKELRQHETLNAFLVSQGEPDLVEVLAIGSSPAIRLTYSRRSAHARGTVDIVASTTGSYYYAKPIKPPSREGTNQRPKRTVTPPPPPKRDPKTEPVPAPEPETPTEPELAEEAEPLIELIDEIVETQQEPIGPQPTDEQRNACPLEPWREDCENLCSQGAGWDWCELDEESIEPAPTP